MSRAGNVKAFNLGTLGARILYDNKNSNLIQSENTISNPHITRKYLQCKMFLPLTCSFDCV